jgi:hypothetical protein
MMHEGEHMQQHFHVIRLSCPHEVEGRTCPSSPSDKIHMATFSHLNVVDIQSPRRLDLQRSTAPQSLQNRRFTTLHFVCETLELARAKNDGVFVDYHHNMARYEELVRDVHPPPEIMEYISRLRPVHRCSLKIFQSMLAHGNIIAMAHMKALKDVAKAKREIRSHPNFPMHVEKLNNAADSNHLDTYAQLVVELVYLAKGLGLLVFVQNLISDFTTRQVSLSSKI